MKLKRDDKKPDVKRPEEKLPEKPVEKPEEKKKDAEKFDLITIVESVEKEIPELEPPFDQILYDFIPESEQRVTANLEDHITKKDGNNNIK